jgi:hypothetical protein
MTGGTPIPSATTQEMSLILAYVTVGKCVVTIVAVIWVMSSRLGEDRATLMSANELTASVSFM